MTLPWQQHLLHFPDTDAARRFDFGDLFSALDAAAHAGLLSDWWFMRKNPFPVRYRATTPAKPITALLDLLVDEEAIRQWTPAIYEPETAAFGGAAAMDVAHRLFAADSHHLLHYDATLTGHLGRRETAVVLATAMTRAAGLDWFEQADVWAKVAELRSTPPRLPDGRQPALAAAMRLLMEADLGALVQGPMRRSGGWISAFEGAGRQLADLAGTGRLERGLRQVLAHLLIFHFNRAALPVQEQSVLSALAKDTVMATKTTTDPAEAARLRRGLLDTLIQNNGPLAPRIEAALRDVDRWDFVPDQTAQQAYADNTVNIKYDEAGASISCASQPTVVTTMLQQLDARPGDKILEIGAGTGYNAALLGHIVGPNGHVTTIDVDDDLVQGAREHLATAGVDNVTVVLGDGALGHPQAAPYDRIIATVGAHGIPSPWLDLVPGGRLLVAHRLRGTVCRSITYENQDGNLVSVNSAMNTFMPLRNSAAADDRHLIRLNPTGLVHLQTNDEHEQDTGALTDVLDQPRTEHWAEVYVQGGESPEWMELWLTCTMPSGLIRMPFKREAVGTVLTDDPYPSSGAVFDKGALCYMARRPAVKTTAEGGKLWEFGVVAHGPGSDDLAARMVEQMRLWDREYRTREAVFELHPLDAAPAADAPGRFTVITPLNRIVIDWR